MGDYTMIILTIIGKAKVPNARGTAGTIRRLRYCLFLSHTPPKGDVAGRVYK
jgi:hypothetical protein